MACRILAILVVSVPSFFSVTARSFSVASHIKSWTLCLSVFLQLSRHFPPTPQDSLLPASLFIPVGASLLAPEFRHLLSLCAFIDFIYLLTLKACQFLINQWEVKRVSHHRFVSRFTFWLPLCAWHFANYQIPLSQFVFRRISVPFRLCVSAVHF